jgi:NitT/TauT family transport system substrate-binding protein
MQSLLGGSSDIVGTGFLAGILMYEEHRPVQSFFLLVQDPGYVALVSPRTARRIRKVEDLRGATVGISSPGSDQQQILNLILTRHGLRPDDIKVVGVGAGMSHAKALEQGAIDVGMAFGTTVAVIQKLYPNISTLFDLRLPEQRRQHLGLEHVPHSVLLAKSNWMRDHPDAVRRIAHATLRAVEWSRAHTAEDIRKRLPGSMRTEDAAVDTEAIRSVTKMLSPDGMFQPEHVESGRKILAISFEAFQRTNLDLSGCYTNDFIVGIQQRR